MVIPLFADEFAQICLLTEYMQEMRYDRFAQKRITDRRCRKWHASIQN